MNKSKALAATKGKRKQYNLQLAKEMCGSIEVNAEERCELNRIFSHDTDRLVGEYIYRLRRGGKSKQEMCAIMSVDRRTLDRLYSTIQYSKFLRFQLEEVVSKSNELTENAPDDPVEAREQRLVKVQNRLNQLLNGLTGDKIYDAELKDIASAYKDLLNAFRLETGQSTNNLAVTGKMISDLSDKNAIKRSEDKMAQIAIQINNVKKLLEKLDERPERTQKDITGDAAETSE